MAENKAGTSNRGAMGGRGPMGGGRRMMQGGEKAKIFSGSFKKLIRYIGNYKFAILAVMIFAAISTVFSVVGPKVMGKATTALAEGLMKKIAGTLKIDQAQYRELESFSKFGGDLDP